MYVIANSQHSTDPILRFHTIIIQILHQTTTERILYKNFVQLYLIKNLHQNTTTWRFPPPRWCYILSKIYIKPQQIISIVCGGGSCILSKIYIKPQRPATNQLIYCVIYQYHPH